MRSFIAAVCIILLTTPLVAAPATTAATKAAATKPVASRPSPRPAERARAAAREAVKALTTEFNAGKLRETSDYFNTGKPAELTDELILAEMAATAFPNPRQTAYVRWQLLSGVSESEDNKIVMQLRRAYALAPQPLPRPGIAPREQQELDKMLIGRKQEDEDALKAELKTGFETFNKSNQPIIAYRDALYARLPLTPEKLAAAMLDLIQRMNAVADNDALLEAFDKDARDWAVTKSPPPQNIAALATSVRQLAQVQGPQYYSSFTWKDNNRAFGWNKSRASVAGGTKLKELAAYLEEQSRVPQLKLGEK